jgi:secreted PhoX family phosphatase
VNIQHPGEETKPDLATPSTFGEPLARRRQRAPPRSATIAITRNDGGPIGLA